MRVGFCCRASIRDHCPLSSDDLRVPYLASLCLDFYMGQACESAYYWVVEVRQVPAVQAWGTGNDPRTHIKNIAWVTDMLLIQALG